MIIDDNLNWNNHVNYISKKIAKGIGISIKARHYLDKDTLLSLYNTFIYPYLTYGNIVWGGTFKYSLDKLYILQKYAVRIISHVNWRHHSEPLFKALAILTIKDIQKYVTAQFMYRSHNSLLPPIFGNFFTQYYDINDHDTRQKKTFTSTHSHPQRLTSGIGWRGIRRNGMFIFNQIITLNVPLDTSLPVVKYNFKRLPNMVKYAMIWFHNHMIDNTPNINQFQHNIVDNINTYMSIFSYFVVFFAAMPAPAPTVLLNILWSETEIGTHKPIWLLVPFVTYTLWHQLLVLVLI